MPKFFLIACFCVAICAESARAHQTLSENVEVNLHDPAVIRVEFTIHAPELPSPVVAGVDPSSVDPAWLAQRSDPEIEQLKHAATGFIRQTFIVRLGDADRLSGAEITFDPVALIRQPPPDTKLPTGCLLATVLMANPGPPEKLRVGFAVGAQKRLLLSVSRPAAFPEVRDLAPGESFDVTLPAAPPSKRSPVLLTFLFAGLVIFVLSVILLWRWRHSRRSRAGTLSR